MGKVNFNKSVKSGHRMDQFQEKDQTGQTQDQSQTVMQNPFLEGTEQDLQQNADQNPILNPNQEQTLESQTQRQRHGDQTQGAQTIGGHTNNSPLTNNQTITTDVSGVTVNVTCCCEKEKKPLKECCEKGCTCKDCKKKRDCGCSGRKKVKKCNDDCDCCTRDLAALLESLRVFQTTAEDTTGIDIYLTGSPSLVNPFRGQIITGVNECGAFTFRGLGQLAPRPNTTVQICKTAGVSAAAGSPEFSFLQSAGAACQNSLDRKKRTCCCGCCAENIAQDLLFASRFGLNVSLLVDGLTGLNNLVVLNVCGCLAFFTIVSIIGVPSEIYVFSVCSITGFTVL
ncbi:hypothetical protein [Metabacillus indicus]|uniref:hypothetical protein n=1 Tax=Metabacillus indicus TaxID=246786 RepID=UPI00068FE23D|nr:hypothetical protein [Metabacillus indicus]